MRIRKLKNAKEIIERSKYVIKSPTEHRGKYCFLFDRLNPIHLEIGMGKGDFLIGMAQKYPDINFIGVEMQESVIARACLKLEELNLDNLKIMLWYAEGLDRVFDHEISKIYLNFSDPWPKARHAKRRLTSWVFLPIYDDISCGNTVIVQKTDNLGLLESSIVNFSCYGYTLKEISFDLANTKLPNVETEYEKKFKAQGVKINYLYVEKCINK